MINTNATAILGTTKLSEVKAVPLPKQTESYMPVAHSDLVKYVETELTEMLPEYKLQKNTYALGNSGQYLFGMASFSNGDDYMGPSIAYRNSYNKDFSVGFAFGAQVFVCANGMFEGDILVAKKHTLNVWDSVREVMTDELGRVGEAYTTIQSDVQALREIKISDAKAWQALGVLRGKSILTARTFEKALKEWESPLYEEHADGTALQLYNACTEAMKLESYPSRAMTQRVKLHKMFQDTLVNRQN